MAYNADVKEVMPASRSQEDGAAVGTIVFNTGARECIANILLLRVTMVMGYEVGRTGLYGWGEAGYTIVWAEEAPGRHSARKYTACRKSIAAQGEEIHERYDWEHIQRHTLARK